MKKSRYSDSQIMAILKQANLKSVFNFSDAPAPDAVLANVAIGDIWESRAMMG